MVAAMVGEGAFRVGRHLLSIELSGRVIKNLPLAVNCTNFDFRTKIACVCDTAWFEGASHVQTTPSG